MFQHQSKTVVFKHENIALLLALDYMLSIPIVQ